MTKHLFYFNVVGMSLAALAWSPAALGCADEQVTEVKCDGTYVDSRHPDGTRFYTSAFSNLAGTYEWSLNPGRAFDKSNGTAWWIREPDASPVYLGCKLKNPTAVNRVRILASSRTAMVSEMHGGGGKEGDHSETTYSIASNHNVGLGANTSFAGASDLQSNWTTFYTVPASTSVSSTDWQQFDFTNNTSVKWMKIVTTPAPGCLNANDKSACVAVNEVHFYNVTCNDPAAATAAASQPESSMLPSDSVSPSVSASAGDSATKSTSSDTNEYTVDLGAGASSGASSAPSTTPATTAAPPVASGAQPSRPNAPSSAGSGPTAGIVETTQVTPSAPAARVSSSGDAPNFEANLAGGARSGGTAASSTGTGFSFGNGGGAMPSAPTSFPSAHKVAAPVAAPAAEKTAAAEAPATSEDPMQEITGSAFRDKLKSGQKVFLESRSPSSLFMEPTATEEFFPNSNATAKTEAGGDLFHMVHLQYKRRAGGL